jgi:hypothetical protein
MKAGLEASCSYKTQKLDGVARAGLGLLEIDKFGFDKKSNPKI